MKGWRELLTGSGALFSAGSRSQARHPERALAPPPEPPVPPAPPARSPAPAPPPSTDSSDDLSPVARALVETLTAEPAEEDRARHAFYPHAPRAPAPPAGPLPELRRFAVPEAAPEPARAPKAPRFVDPPSRPPRERLVLVDLGEIRTTAHGYDVTNGTPVLVGRCDVESAVCEGGMPSRFGAPRGMRIATSERVEPPMVIGCFERPGRLLAVGRPAADLGGSGALVCEDPSAARLEAILRAVVFPMVRPGDKVEVECIQGPNAAARGLEQVLGAWNGRAVALEAVSAESSELERREVHVTTRFVQAGDAFLELAHERELIHEEGAPILVLDLGHRNSRLYLLDFESGLLDLDIVPHGGMSFLLHANRYAEERRWQPGGDVGLLRQLDEGTEMLTFGGMSFVTRQFFQAPREELLKAIVQVLIRRLRNHVERGGRWPEAMLVCGGGADAHVKDIAQLLKARGYAIGRAEAFRRRPSPVLEGAYAAYRLRTGIG